MPHEEITEELVPVDPNELAEFFESWMLHRYIGQGRARLQRDGNAPSKAALVFADIELKLAATANVKCVFVKCALHAEGSLAGSLLATEVIFSDLLKLAEFELAGHGAFVKSMDNLVNIHANESWSGMDGAREKRPQYRRCLLASVIGTSATFPHNFMSRDWRSRRAARPRPAQR